MLHSIYSTDRDLPQLVYNQITRGCVDGWFSHCDRCDQ